MHKFNDKIASAKPRTFEKEDKSVVALLPDGLHGYFAELVARQRVDVTA